MWYTKAQIEETEEPIDGIEEQTDDSGLPPEQYLPSMPGFYEKMNELYWGNSNLYRQTPWYSRWLYQIWGPQAEIESKNAIQGEEIAGVRG